MDNVGNEGVDGKMNAILLSVACNSSSASNRNAILMLSAHKQGPTVVGAKIKWEAHVPRQPLAMFNIAGNVGILQKHTLKLDSARCSIPPLNQL